MVEDAMFRQQLILLINRQIKRPRPTNSYRFRLVFLSHFTKFWKQALVLAPSFIRPGLLGKTVSFPYV
jgi:hypothetical protein